MPVEEWLQEQIENSPIEFGNNLTEYQLPDLRDLLPEVSGEWDNPHTAKMGALQVAIRPYCNGTVSAKSAKVKAGAEGSVAWGRPAKMQGRRVRGKRNSPKYQSTRR